MNATYRNIGELPLRIYETPDFHSHIVNSLNPGNEIFVSEIVDTMNVRFGKVTGGYIVIGIITVEELWLHPVPETISMAVRGE